VKRKRDKNMEKEVDNTMKCSKTFGGIHGHIDKTNFPIDSPLHTSFSSHWSENDLDSFDICHRKSRSLKVRILERMAGRFA